MIRSRLQYIKRRITQYKDSQRDFESKKEELDELLKSGNPRSFQVDFAKHLVINESSQNTDYDRHYVLHLAWAVRRIAEEQPVKHVDISSSLHFCTMLSAFLPVEFYDYRPAKIKLSNMTSDHANLVHMDFDDGSLSSLSCMHVVEHIGLGRYGDPIDYSGDLKAMNELARVLKPGGKLYFVTPVGKPRIVFNRHRIYSYGQILQGFDSLEMISFTLIPDDAADGDLIENASESMANEQSYGCGCWVFTKK